VSTAPIQAAVDAAGEGDAIYVEGGSYYENVNVNKEGLTLEGEGADMVTVTAVQMWCHVFEVAANYVNISGFTVTGATGYPLAGIHLYNANHCNIYDNSASNNGYGIYLAYSSNNTLQSNTANLNNDYGIYLEYSSNNTLTNNTISGNTSNFGVSGDNLSHYTQNMDTNNTVDGKTIYYWVDQKDGQIPNDAGFVGVVNSTNITVKNLTLTNNTQGVLFAYTDDSMIENVTALDNEYGITLWTSSNNTLQGNTALNNYYGIYMWSSSNNTLQNNTASNNDFVIILLNSSNNTLQNNTASNNENGITLWDSSNNMLQSNTASNNWYGIYTYYSSNNTLINNTMSGNMRNFGIHGYSLSCYVQNMDTSNTVDGKTIYYWVDQKDGQIPDDAGFVGVVNSTNITVKNLTLSNNSRGVLFAYTSNSRIENVSASNDYYGIYLYSSSNNTLTNNIANSNNEDGIYLHSSNNNTLSDNNVSYNDDKGINMHFSDNNMIQNNNANSNTWHGICLLASNDNMMSDNNASSNGRIGISLSSSNNNTLSGNTANSNSYYYGIHLHYSNNNNITCNWVQNNIRQGFYLSDSTNNNISYNNIIENGNYDTSTGGWEWQFYNNQPEAVDAKHNYWGAGMNNSTIDASIYDDNEGMGKGEFYPFETEPVPCAPTPEEPHTFTTTDAVIALQIAAGSRQPTGTSAAMAASHRSTR
jgi:parallel beta-helix repeat protein